ncbi:type B DNA-directed DNA polymerase [Halorubrum trapanicum]|uniref:type B DNA-directed DNA polymerase n=1 Tax=Halorubrum trapanicum TaxID=29284 RepID=UPI003C6FDAFA
MVLTVDFQATGDVVCWTLTDDGVARTVHDGYMPTLFVGDAVRDLYGRRGGQTPTPPDRDGLSESLTELRAFLDGQDAVDDLQCESHRQTFRTDPRPLLRIDATSVDAVRRIAQRVQQFNDPAEYTCYNVDFTRQFRYCLETDTTASPNQSVRQLRRLTLSIPPHKSGRAALTHLTIDGDAAGPTPEAAIKSVDSAVREQDPDIVVVSTAELIPLLFQAADTHDVPGFKLGRASGYTKLAGKSTYTSYGQVGHSPARYTVPGRVVIDESNTFFYHESGLSGCLDLIARAGLPLEELSWASIGRVLTALQIRAARDRDVLVPWQAWRPEFFKSAATLDVADRGGTTFAPDVGVHENVHELDFASLYPNIIRTRNISPETIRCGCCNSDDVPGLGYSICDTDGYLPTVLGPLIDSRSRIKTQIRSTDDDAERERLEAAASALKWILVSCFGYQGFSNAKFGRIECHEAINAFAREILLDAKTALENAGWRVLHGIIDSIWVTPLPNCDQRSLETVATEISAETEIKLEYESAFDWVAFCPMRNSDSGALTRYFGKRRGETTPSTGELGDAIKTRGIETRQRSTPPWVTTVQEDALRVFDATRSPEDVCDVLRRHLTALSSGDVPTEDLVVANRVSKRADAYTQETLTVAALRRTQHHGTSLAPGQTVRYVVANADGHGIDRVRLTFEDPQSYDIDWYEDAAIRAVESIISCVGWDRTDIEQYLAETADTTLGSYHTDP